MDTIFGTMTSGLIRIVLATTRQKHLGQKTEALGGLQAALSNDDILPFDFSASPSAATHEQKKPQITPMIRMYQGLLLFNHSPVSTGRFVVQFISFVSVSSVRSVVSLSAMSICRGKLTRWKGTVASS